MADVQLEHGYVRYANAYHEALLRAPLPGRHRRVLDAVVRLTWGWNRPEAAVSSTAVAELTDLSAGQVREVVRGLVAWGLLERRSQGGPRPPILRPVKDYERWAVPPARRPVHRPARGPVHRPAALPRGKTTTDKKDTTDKPAGAAAGSLNEAQARAYWCSHYERTQRSAYAWRRKDWELLRGLVEAHGRQTVAQLILRFLGSERLKRDPWVSRTEGFSVFALTRRAQGLVREVAQQREAQAAREKETLRQSLERAAEEIQAAGFANVHPLHSGRSDRSA